MLLGEFDFNKVIEFPLMNFYMDMYDLISIFLHERKSQKVLKAAEVFKKCVKRKNNECTYIRMHIQIETCFLCKWHCI